MLALIKERLGNLLQLITSKKTLVGVAAAAVIIHTTDLSKIIAIGCIAVAYIIAQGLIDLQKAKQAK